MWLPEPPQRRTRICQRASQHRGAKIADLVIAAAAEAAQLVVLHDHDFDLIAGVTGQPVDRIVGAGTVS